MKAVYSDEYKSLFKDTKDLNGTFDVLEIYDNPQYAPGKWCCKENLIGYLNLAILSNGKTINTYWLKLIEE